MTETSDRLKCKFCDWTTKKAFTAKSGKFRGVDAAHLRLQEHCIMNHWEEYEKILDLLKEEPE